VGLVEEIHPEEIASTSSFYDLSEEFLQPEKAFPNAPYLRGCIATGEGIKRVRKITNEREKG